MLQLMGLVAPIAVGFAGGLAIGLPYLVALRHMKKTREASVAPGIIAVCASFAVAALLLFAFWYFWRAELVPCVLALIGAFLLVVVVGVVVFGRKPR